MASKIRKRPYRVQGRIFELIDFTLFRSISLFGSPDKLANAQVLPLKFFHLPIAVFAGFEVPPRVYSRKTYKISFEK